MVRLEGFIAELLDFIREDFNMKRHAMNWMMKQEFAWFEGRGETSLKLLMSWPNQWIYK